MKHTILTIFFALLLLSEYSSVYASDLNGNKDIQLEDPLLQEKLATYVNLCDSQFHEDTTIARISTCLEKNNGILTLGNGYAGEVRTLKGLEGLEGLHIKQLNIENTHASGQSIADLTPLANIKSLESLKLYGTYSNDFFPLATLPNLKELVINSTNNEPLQSISLLKNLQTLQLSGSQVTSLAGIERMKQLTSLAIDDVSIPDYGALTNVPQLKKLSVDFNGNSRFLQSLSNLEALTLAAFRDEPKIINGDDLKKLTRLKTLRLFNIEANYDYLNNMPRLEELKISNRDASSLLSAINEPLVYLKSLDISQNELSSIEGAEKLSVLFPSIEKLNLRGNEIADLSPLVQTERPYQYLKDLDIDGNIIFDINILGEHANLFPSLETIYAESNYIHSISEMTKLPVLQSLFSGYNLIDVFDEQNPKKFIGHYQFELGKLKPLEMSIGDVYDGPILSKVSISDEDWRDEIKSSNLTVTFSDPEVAELTKKGNILAKKAGTTTVTYSIKGATDPYFTHSTVLTVLNKHYKPYDPRIEGDITLQTNKMSVYTYGEDKVVIASNGKVIAEVVPSGWLTFTLPNLKGLKELQVWSESKLGVKSNVITMPIYKTEKPTLPDIESVTDQTEYITGTADPHTTVYITSREEESFKELTQKVSDKGTFKIYTGKLHEGISIIIYSKNEEGRESGNLGTTVQDVTPPAMPILDNVTSESLQIIGKTEAHAKVTIKRMSRNIGDTLADQNGIFKFSISAPSVGDTFTAIAEDKSKNKSKEASIVTILPIKEEEIIPKKPVFWKGLQLKKGQIGLVTITKKINLWKREGDKLVFQRILNPGEVYRVYGYDSKYGGQYGVGGGLFITNINGYVKYQTPSKAILSQVK